MLGVQIFIHSLRQVTGNLGMAIRVSWWFIAVIAVAAWQVTEFIVSGSLLQEIGTAFGWLAFALAIFVIWGGALIAVVWHRYILLAEIPTGIIPYRRGLNVWTYFWYGFGLIMFLLLLLIVMGFVGILVVGQGNETAATIFGFIIGFVLSVLFYRMALILPAVAIDKTLKIADAMDKTRDAMGAIVVLAVCGLVLNLALTTVISMIFGSGPEMALQSFENGAAYTLPSVSLPFLLVSGAVQWFNLMLGVSILSTLYGYFVEKRELM